MKKNKLVKSTLAGVTAITGVTSSIVKVFANEGQVSFELKKDDQKIFTKQAELENRIHEIQGKVCEAKLKEDTAKGTLSVAKKDVEINQNQYDETNFKSKVEFDEINREIDLRFQPIIDEIAKLENEISKTNKELDTQKSISEKASEDLKTAQSDLETKQKELADLKTCLESFGVKDYSELESEVNKATETLNEASASAESVKQILAEKELELETAKEGVETAQSGLQMATEALERANADVKSAEGEVITAQNNLSKFTDENEYNKCLERLEQAKVNLESAKNNVIAKTSDLETAKTNLVTAESVQAEKQAEYDTSVTALDEANAKVAEAETTKDEAQKALDEAVKMAGIKEDEINDLKNRITVAEKDVANAQNIYDKAKSDYDSTLTPLELAQKNLADYEKAHADQLSQLNQGIQGYYDSIGAIAATDIIKNPRGKLNGHTNIGATNDATSLDNVINSISYLKEFNKIRVSEGLPELKVSMVLMAISQVNANWQRDTAEIGNVAHSGVYNTGENAAWGYGEAESKASPFTVWYNLEKSWYQNGITDFHKVGHYKNIISKAYDYTGYAHIEEGCYGSTDIQEFDQYWGENAYGVEATGSKNDRIITLEEFETSLNNYASGLKDVSTQHNALEEAVKKVQTGGTEKDDAALKSALALLNNCKGTLEVLNEQMTKATLEKTEVDTAKAEAEANFQKAEQAVKEAEANVEAKVTARATAEANLSKAKAEVTAKKIAKAEAENNLVKANQDVTHISETIDVLTHTVNNWSTEKAKSEKALETAQAHLKEAKVNLELKTKNLESTKENLEKVKQIQDDAQTVMDKTKVDSEKAVKSLKEAQFQYDILLEKVNAYKNTSGQVGSTSEDVTKLTTQIFDLKKSKEMAESNVAILENDLDASKMKVNQLSKHKEQFNKLRNILATVLTNGTNADLSEISDLALLQKYKRLAHTVDVLNISKKNLEEVKLDYKIKESSYLKAHEELNNAVDEYNKAMADLNSYLRKQNSQERDKEELSTDFNQNKKDSVNTGVDASISGYMASASLAGLSLVGSTGMKRRKKQIKR